MSVLAACSPRTSGPGPKFRGEVSVAGDDLQQPVLGRVIEEMEPDEPVRPARGRRPGRLRLNEDVLVAKIASGLQTVVQPAEQSPALTCFVLENRLDDQIGLGGGGFRSDAAGNPALESGPPLLSGLKMLSLDRLGPGERRSIAASPRLTYSSLTSIIMTLSPFLGRFLDNARTHVSRLRRQRRCFNYGLPSSGIQPPGL